jgi:hypothetical protein
MPAIRVYQPEGLFFTSGDFGNFGIAGNPV